MPWQGHEIPARVEVRYPGPCGPRVSGTHAHWRQKTSVSGTTSLGTQAFLQGVDPSRKAPGRVQRHWEGY